MQMYGDVKGFPEHNSALFGLVIYDHCKYNIPCEIQLIDTQISSPWDWEYLPLYISPL